MKKEKGKIQKVGALSRAFQNALCVMLPF